MRPKIERDAFERLVREHHAAAYRAALRVARDEGAALDAVQQTFLAVLEGRARLEPGSDAGKLLRCVAARQAAMRLRSEQARAHRETEVGMRRTQGVEAGDAAEREALQAELAALPDELRLAVVLRYQEDLTLAEIGEVLAISPPSVHGRLERALEKLRERLGRVGFAAVLPRLPEYLAQAEEAPVPPQALPRLLAIAPSTLALGTLAPLVAVALLAVAGAAYVWPRGPEPESGTERTLASAAPAADPLELPPRESARAVVTGTESSVPAATAETLAEGRIVGQVRDQLGIAVEGAKVSASSVERGGKFSTWSRSTLSARDGSFELSLPVGVASGQDYTLAAETPSLVQQAGVIRVRSGETAPFQRIQLFAPVTDRAGAWELNLAIRDPAGRAVGGAVARVHRSVTHESGASWLEWQAGGRANDAGELTLRGEGLGTRVLNVDARDQGFALLNQRVELEASGATAHVAVLQQGLSIRGTIVDEHGVALDARRLGGPTGMPLYASGGDANAWLGAEFPEPGRFEIRALVSEPHDVHFRSERWSPFTLQAVRPGGDELALQLKSRIDPRDVGLHDAEIHARLVDAATGAGVEAASTWTWIDRIGDGSPCLADGDFTALMMEQVVVQTEQGPQLEEPPQEPPPDALICVGLEAGRYVVRVRAPGYAPALLGPLELGPREIASGRIVRLTRGALVRGVVQDEQGRALAGARVLALGSGALSRQSLSELDLELRQTAGRGTIHSAGTATGADGRFELASVPAGLGLHLFVLHPEHEPADGGLLELVEGQAAPERLLKPGPRRAR